MSHKPLRAPIAALLLATLIACGGGSGGSPTATAPVDPDPVPGTGMPDPGNGTGTVIDTGSAATTGRMGNPSGADLAWHWHDTIGRDALTDALDLAPAAGNAASRLAAIRRAAGKAAPANVDVLGMTGSFMVGRWTSGPADHIPITIDYRLFPDIPAQAKPQIERAAKLWSQHIRGVLDPYDIDDANVSETVLNRTPRLPAGTSVTTTHGTVVFVRDGAETFAANPGIVGLGANWAIQVNDQRYHARTGTITFNPRLLANGQTGYTAAHEIGHVLTHPTANAYRARDEHGNFDPNRAFRGPHARYIDYENAVWTGPAASAVHGSPVPFRILHEHDGVVDSSHWHADACPSTLAHGCGTPNGPSALDVAYLKDLGYRTADQATADATEMYSYGAWAEASAFSVTVARDLESYVDDSMAATAVAFGIPPGTTFAEAHSGMSGSATWSGILLGADIGTPGLPPVAGDAAITVQLADLAGTARFSHLQVLTHGEAAPFRSPTLEYDYTISGNTFGNGRPMHEGQLHGAWYGTGHDEVAGTVADGRMDVMLIGAFGGTR